MDANETRKFREGLAEDVRTFRLSPQEADAQLIERGLEPFRQTPDPAAYDPVQETHWSIIMTLAWIVWRTPEAVREVWDAYRAEKVEWRFCQWRSIRDSDPADGATRQELRLEQGEPVEMRDLNIMETTWPNRLCRVEKAQADLLKRLRSGEVTAEGRNAKTGKHELITALAWRGGLCIRENEHGPSTVYVESLTLHPERYDGVLIEREGVERIWTRPNDGHRVEERNEGAADLPQASAAPKHRDEAAESPKPDRATIEQTYKEIASGSGSERRLSLNEEWTEMKRRLPRANITRDRVRELRRKHAPGNRGRPKKRP